MRRVETISRKILSLVLTLFDSIQMEGIVQMFSVKRHQMVITFNEINDEHIAIIVTVGC